MAMRVTGMRVDGVSEPLGLDASRPQLSWRLEGPGRGLRQSAYRITVATSEAALRAGQADLWDSGKVLSDATFAITYAGTPLASRQRVWWRVQVWDRDGAPRAPGPLSWWEMGLLAPDDWRAQWLAVEDLASQGDREAGLPAVWGETPVDAVPRKFRFAFNLPETPVEARLVIVAQNRLAGLWINGLAQAHGGAADIDMVRGLSVALVPGDNLVAAEVAVDAVSPIGPPGGRLAALLRITLPDGEVRRLVTGAGWKTATLAPEGWVDPGFDDKGWSQASPAPPRFGPDPWPASPAMHLRAPFRVERPVRQARLYATALGAYEARLNGARVSDALLTPESSDFRQRVLYRTFDVTEMIAEGENVLGFTVGDGWYASALVVVGRYAWGPAPRRLLAQLEIDYADGDREIIASEPSWRRAASPILASELYDGEIHDARLNLPGWDAPGFDASAWADTIVMPPPPLRIEAQVCPPIRQTQILRALTVSSPKSGVYVFDFGQTFAGWCRLRVSGGAGVSVELRFAEILKASGEVDQANLRAARASDIFTLRGDPAGETFEPKFTYHGFRHVEVHGFPGTPTADHLQGVVIQSDLAPTGILRIDNPLIDQFWRNTVWSQRSNFTGIPTDCPQRDERMGWLGDAEVFWDAAAFNMDVQAFTRRFMGEVRASQHADGVFADIAPCVLPPFAGSPGWADGGVILPWTTWRRYGDTAVIDENWEAMERWLAVILEGNPDHLWRNRRGMDFGDWLSLDGESPGDPTTPKDLVGTAFWARTSALMQAMAEATGRAERARWFRDLNARIVAAFNAAFVGADGRVGNDSQTSYILALGHDLLPDALRRPAAERLAANIRGRGTLLSTGFLGTPASLDVLADAGFADLVYDLLLRTDYPSWGYMVAKGATTIWERWNGDVGDVAMNSFNHYALGAVCGFLFRRVAGIAPAAPGFRRILIRPVLDPRVRNGGGDYDSVAGRISTTWRQGPDGALTLDVTLPPNTTGEIHLPTRPGAAIKEGGRAIDGRRDITVLSRANDLAVLEMGSGDYRFATGPS
jgi:alpha-L-rhamnosidase